MSIPPVHRSQMADQLLAYAQSRSAAIDPYDLLFVLTAVAFNLLIAGIFVAQKAQRPRLRGMLGILWLLLAIPLAIVFVRYLIAGREPWIMIYFAFILLYMAVELLLDYVFKVEFRQKWITHAPYIVLEYIGLFGLIGISFAIDRTWGFVVAVSFWILMASLVYLYWDRISARRRESGA